MNPRVIQWRVPVSTDALRKADDDGDLCPARKRNDDTTETDPTEEQQP